MAGRCGERVPSHPAPGPGWSHFGCGLGRGGTGRLVNPCKWSGVFRSRPAGHRDGWSAASPGRLLRGPGRSCPQRGLPEPGRRAPRGRRPVAGEGPSARSQGAWPHAVLPASSPRGARGARGEPPPVRAGLRKDSGLLSRSPSCAQRAWAALLIRKVSDTNTSSFVGFCDRGNALCGAAGAGAAAQRGTPAGRAFVAGWRPPSLWQVSFPSFLFEPFWQVSGRPPPPEGPPTL